MRGREEREMETKVPCMKPSGLVHFLEELGMFVGVTNVDRFP